MLSTYLLARDHLECAAAILQGSDNRSQQLRNIIERTVALMDDAHPRPQTISNVLDFAEFRERVARS
ncbi:hypothetical protein [Devosia submarina]|uniref:hypothetical protein n=1 Tax=Devosia submarina TaxID=1173082 RepID=UPI0013002729|nr:hypothetical protein [Devosia submarina]